MKQYLIGFAIGLVITVCVFIWQLIKRKSSERALEKEIKSLKEMVATKMEVEADGLAKIKLENENLAKQNENLRITNAALMQKPGRAEINRLQIYQKAVDRLIINSPGFGAAWQSALKESEDEFAQIYSGIQAFWKKVLPGRTDAKPIDDKDIIDEQ